MTRIKESDLENIVGNINIKTKSPVVTWTKNKDGKLVSNIGNYHLSFAYGGVTLHRIMNE